MTDQQQQTSGPIEGTVERTADARVGFGSKFGAGAAAVAVLIPAVGELADATEPLGVPPITWVISSAVLASLVIIGRYGQAFIDRWRQR